MDNRQADLAMRIAVQQALEHQGLADSAERNAERVAHKKVAGQLRKAAAELGKGNVPLHTCVNNVDVYLVESRSTLIGKPIEIRVSGQFADLTLDILMQSIRRSLERGESIKSAVANGDIEMKFAITSGDVYIVNPTTMSCECEQGQWGCWHYSMVDCWIEAGNILKAKQAEMATAEQVSLLGDIDDIWSQS